MRGRSSERCEWAHRDNAARRGRIVSRLAHCSDSWFCGGRACATVAPDHSLVVHRRRCASRCRIALPTKVIQDLSMPPCPFSVGLCAPALSCQRANGAWPRPPGCDNMHVCTTSVPHDRNVKRRDATGATISHRLRAHWRIIIISSCTPPVLGFRIAHRILMSRHFKSSQAGAGDMFRLSQTLSKPPESNGTRKSDAGIGNIATATCPKSASPQPSTAPFAPARHIRRRQTHETCRGTHTT